MEQMDSDFNREARNHACEPEEALCCRISANGPNGSRGQSRVYKRGLQGALVDRWALSICAFTISDTGPLHVCA